jgi:hypothetical protein
VTRTAHRQDSIDAVTTNEHLGAEGRGSAYYDQWPLLNGEPNVNWKPGKPMRERKSVAHTLDGARLMVRSASRRSTADLPDLVALVKLDHEVDAALHTMVARLRAEDGASWADIGRVLGTSRQAAQQRFGDGECKRPRTAEEIAAIPVKVIEV